MEDLFSPLNGRAPSIWDSPRRWKALVPSATELEEIPVALKSTKNCVVQCIGVDMPRVQASLTIGAADPGTAQVAFKAVAGGPDGNNLRVAVVRTGTAEQPSFTLERNLLTVSVGASAELTAEALVEAFQVAAVAIREVFEVSLPDGSGAGNVEAAAAAHLAGGSLGTLVPVPLNAGVTEPMQPRVVRSVDPADAKLTAMLPTSIEHAKAVV